MLVCYEKDAILFNCKQFEERVCIYRYAIRNSFCRFCLLTVWRRNYYYFF